MTLTSMSHGQLWTQLYLELEAVSNGAIPVLETLVKAFKETSASPSLALDESNEFEEDLESPKLSHTSLWSAVIWKGQTRERSEELTLNMVKILLGAGLSVNDTLLAPMFDCQPLHVAAGKGYISVVKELLDHGANVNAQDDDSWTPILWAAHNGYEKMCILLMENGATLEGHDSHRRIHRQSIREKVDPECYQRMEEIERVRQEQVALEEILKQAASATSVRGDGEVSSEEEIKNKNTKGVSGLIKRL